MLGRCTRSGLIAAVGARRRGELADDDVGDAVRFVLDTSGPPAVTYFGTAVKQ